MQNGKYCIFNVNLEGCLIRVSFIELLNYYLMDLEVDLASRRDYFRSLYALSIASEGSILVLRLFSFTKLPSDTWRRRRRPTVNSGRCSDADRRPLNDAQHKKHRTRQKGRVATLPTYENHSPLLPPPIEMTMATPSTPGSHLYLLKFITAFYSYCFIIS